VFPLLPELPELPDVALLRLEEAFPVSPELALPEVAEVSEPESAFVPLLAWESEPFPSGVHSCPYQPCSPPPFAVEVVVGLDVAEPVVPPLPELPERGFEFTVALPVFPVLPVFPELPEVADESDLQKRARQGAKFTAGPVLPELPDLPELPEVAVFPFEEALPVSPELALPEVAPVSEYDFAVLEWSPP
jgi:hypothetical protein